MVSTIRIYRTSVGLCGLLCLATGLLVACEDTKTLPTPSVGHVDLAVAGQTVIKVRTAGSHVVLLEERLNSIFEDGPQRTLATLQSDGHTVQKTYMPPPGWSVIDFAVHPSGDISAILITATGVRIVRLDPHASIRSDQLSLDPSSSTDPFFNHAGGIKNDDALQPALMQSSSSLL